MGPFEMVLGIVLIVTIGNVARSTMKPKGGAPKQERERVEREMRDMKERIAVLERLATDDGARLTHEIERLRDRDRV